METNFESDASTCSADDWAEYQGSESGSGVEAAADRMDVDEGQADEYEDEEEPLMETNDSDWESVDSDSSSPKKIDFADMIDTSLYRQIAFVVRSNLSKKPKSIAELQVALQVLRKVWEPYVLPDNQQTMKYSSTNYVNVRLYRHNRTSLLHPGKDPGFVQLQKLLNLEDSALVISGLDGLTADSAVLSQYLCRFERDTMLYFFVEGRLRWKYKSKDLASQLSPMAPEPKDPLHDVQSWLGLIKMTENMRETSWSMSRLFGSVDTDVNGPRPVTPHMIKILEKMNSIDARVLSEIERARQELAQINEKKRELKAPLLLAASKQQALVTTTSVAPEEPKSDT